MNAIHARWWGVVQGVGFRASARRIALANGCVGWVRNLSDGSVDAHIQGFQAAIDASVAGIAQLHGRRIHSVSVYRTPLEGSLESFTIVASATAADVAVGSDRSEQAPK